MNTSTYSTIDSDTDQVDKPLVLYHANCADGFGAAFSAWTRLKDDGVYVPIQYNGYEYNAHTGILKVGSGLDAVQYTTYGRIIYILDFSFPKDVMTQLFETSHHVIWLDHHKSAFELYDCVPNTDPQDFKDSLDLLVDSKHKVLLDNTRSGALIAWEFFHSCHWQDRAPLFIKLLDDYDRWQFKLNGTKEFQKALWSFKELWSFDTWNKWFFAESGFEKDPKDTVYSFIAQGDAIIRYHNSLVTGIVDSCTRECTITWKHAYEVDNPHEDGKTLYATTDVFAHGLAANAPAALSSDVGHQLANKSGTFGLVWLQDTNGRVKCSLRSNGDFDVSAIAKKFGGGGHKNAAGFELHDINQLLRWMYPDRRTA